VVAGLTRCYASHELPRTLSISGSIAHQLSAIRFNESRLSNPLVPHGANQVVRIDKCE
jgi:hypothetical protein